MQAGGDSVPHAPAEPDCTGCPRPRGSAVRRKKNQSYWQIIPACAGSTGVGVHFLIFAWDHPRMRGEHTPNKVAWLDVSGSSPHARGAPHAPTSPHGHTTDHPRMRGEHTLYLTSRVTPSGSSPHARGAPLDGERLLRISRIIPACAGSTDN